MATQWPSTLCPTEMTFGIVHNNRAFTSVLSNAQQVVGFPGDYWQCQLTFNNLNREKGRALTALLGSLRGMVGTVNIPYFTRRRTDDIGSPVVVSGTAQSTTMILSGVTASRQVFAPGDCVTVAGQLFEVVAPAVSTSGGQVTLQLNRRIRSQLAAGSAVEYRNPYSEMRRADDTNTMSVQALISNGSFEFREAF